MKYRIVDSPIGELLLVGSDDTLTALYTPGQRRPGADVLGERDDTAFAETARQLGEYFAGERVAFDVPIAPDGTAFQQRVWAELRKIPHGETASYGEIAGRLGNPNASRAVGAANGRNPISIIVPCHRVIGASGTLTGYAGGLEAKAWLLAHEKTTATAPSR